MAMLALLVQLLVFSWVMACEPVLLSTPWSALQSSISDAAHHRHQGARNTRGLAPLLMPSVSKTMQVAHNAQTTISVISQQLGHLDAYHPWAWHFFWLTAILLGCWLWLRKRRTQRCSLNLTWTAVNIAGEVDGARKKRKRKNKYAHFSKVEDLKLDPLQELEQFAADYNAKQQQARQQRAPAAPVKLDANLKKGAAQVIIPNNLEEINPYDPSTFGFLEVGRIEKPHGLFGEMKVRAITDFGPQRLCTPGLTNLKAPNRRFPRPRILENGRLQDKDLYIVKIQGVDTVEQANALRGYTIYTSMALENRPALEKEEWLVTDLVGLKVVLLSKGREIGHVRAILLGDELCSIPGIMHDLLDVELYDFTLDINQYRTVYIPFVPQMVPVVNLETRQVTIDPPDGFMEMSTVRTKEVVIRGLLPP